MTEEMSAVMKWLMYFFIVLSIAELLSHGQLGVVLMGALFAKTLSVLHRVEGHGMTTLLALCIVEVEPGLDGLPESGSVRRFNFDNYRVDDVLIHTYSIWEPIRSVKLLVNVRLWLIPCLSYFVCC